MSKKKVIIVGAGAAGFMAGIRAAELGADVLLFEHKQKPGRKLMITGKGRCNITNAEPLLDFIKHFYPNGRFLRQAFDRFFSDDIVSFFKEQGVDTTVERGGRIFPTSGKAQDVVEAFLKRIKELPIQIKTGWAVTDFIQNDEEAAGVKACKAETKKGKIYPDQSTEKIFNADAVIVATGGASYPATGSNGAGYSLAESVGHTIVPIRPALVPLVTAGDNTKDLDGLNLRNIKTTLWVDNKKKGEAFGEMSFTKFGIAGPVILTMSAQIVDFLREGKNVSITLDLKPSLDDKKLDARLLRELEGKARKKYPTILKELLPAQLIPFCLSDVGIDPNKTCARVSGAERKKLKKWLKEQTFDIVASRSFNEAIVTAGGISLKEINPRTMESRKLKKLYFVGEILDIQADTGGYNLQAAFSTGYLAAEEAIKED